MYIRNVHVTWFSFEKLLYTSLPPTSNVYTLGQSLYSTIIFQKFCIRTMNYWQSYLDIVESVLVNSVSRSLSLKLEHQHPIVMT